MINKKYYSTLHINSIIGGCRRAPKLFIPKTEQDFNLLKVPNMKCNLRSTEIKVSVNKWLPLCDLDFSDPTNLRFKHSTNAEMLNILERKYNFYSKLVFANQIWGQKVNGTWNGMIGNVVYQKSDIAVCGLTRTTQRMLDVSFTNFVFDDVIIFFMESPGIAKRNWMFLKPFKLDVWLTLALSFASLSFLLYLISPSNDRINLNLFGMLINQSILKNEKCFATIIRLLIGIWILVAFILTNTYSSSFYSILTIPVYEKTINTIRDLATAAIHDTHYILTWPNSSYTSIFTKADPSNKPFYEIGKHIIRNNRVQVQDEEHQFKLLEQDSRNIIISSLSYLNKWNLKMVKKPLHFGNEIVSMLFTGIVMSKRSPLKMPFNFM
ncbi:hypothetical protein RDWZM_000513 [Blomia tropicalis]|uniref:Ionotropic glutamate receptor L-glutamate and glycine-binding domain-containing protein n=1 Tax=Blomia tropicalis TaxID=40697 RepID=A0A9Q0MB18_BLOTA|nr:hypothetical protein RDWZM_000513 [Blomia tropicalis]